MPPLLTQPQQQAYSGARLDHAGSATRCPLSRQPDSRTSLRLDSLGSETRSHPLNIEYCAALIVSTAHLEVAGQVSSCCPPHLLLGLPTLCSLQSPPALRHTNNQQTGGSVGHDFWVPLMKQPLAIFRFYFTAGSHSRHQFSVTYIATATIGEQQKKTTVNINYGTRIYNYMLML